MTPKKGKIIFDSESNSGTILPDPQDATEAEFSLDITGSPSAIDYNGHQYVICKFNTPASDGKGTYILWQLDVSESIVKYWPIPIDNVDGNPNFATNNGILYLFYNSGKQITIQGLSIVDDVPQLDPPTQTEQYCVGSDIRSWYNPQNKITYCAYTRGNCGEQHDNRVIRYNFPSHDTAHVGAQNVVVNTSPAVAFVSENLIFFYQDSNTGTLMANDGFGDLPGPSGVMSNSPSAAINSLNQLYVFYQGSGNNGNLCMVQVNPKAVTFDTPNNNLATDVMVNSPSAIYVEKVGYMVAFYQNKQGHLGYTTTMGS